VRAILHFMGDHLAGEGAELLEPFAAIDSQTDHIALDASWAFPRPSPRVMLNVKPIDGRLIPNADGKVFGPSDAGYRRELDKIFSLFLPTYLAALRDLVRSRRARK
jgi:hypothetical protein